MNHKNYFLLSLSIGLSALMISCSQDTKSKLVGEWQLIRDSISCTNPQIDSLEAAEKGNFQTAQSILAQEAKDNVREGQLFKFDKNDSYQQNSGKLRFTGKYKIEHDSGLFLLGPMNILTGFYVINSISKDALKMTKSFSMKDHSHTYVENFRRKK